MKQKIYDNSTKYTVSGSDMANGGVTGGNIAGSSEYVMDMTQGNITGILLRFSIPLLIGNLFQQVYNIVDSIVVGRHLGSKALGAVGSVGMISFLFFSLCMGLSSGIGVIISNYFGAKKDEDVKCAIANSIYVIVAAGIIMSILGYTLTEPILKLMNTPAENFEYAKTYMQITCGLTIVVALYNGISAILRALGDSKVPLIFLIVASVINIVLDLLFVIKLNMGVAGAAYATVISQFISAAGSILFAIFKNPYFKLKRGHFKLNKGILKEDLRIGIPMSIQTAMVSISCSLLQTLINGYGTDVMAAYTATGKVENIVFQPFASLGTAVSTFASQNQGAKEYKRIQKAVIRAEIITAVISAALLVAILFFRSNIIGIFVEESAVIELGSKGLLIAGSMYFFLGTIYILRGALNGMGDVFFSIMNGILEVGGRVAFAAFFMYCTSLGFWGVWYTNIFTWIIISLCAAVRLYIVLKNKSRFQK